MVCFIGLTDRESMHPLHIRILVSTSDRTTLLLFKKYGLRPALGRFHASFLRLKFLISSHSFVDGLAT